MTPGATAVGVGEDDLVTGDAVALRVPAAGPGLRVAAAAIDIGGAVLLLLGLLLVFRGALEAMDEAAAAALGIVVLVTVTVITPATIETLTGGRSLGRWICGTCIVRDDGGPVAFRQALTRALVGFLELWLTSGTVAFCAVVLSARGKRLGDMAAGTYAVRDRMRLTLPDPVTAVPELEGWARTADLAPLPEGLALAVRQFLHRLPQLEPVARRRVGEDLAAAVAARVMPMPPPGTHPEALLRAVLAERSRRDSLRLADERQRREALLGPPGPRG